MARQRSNWMREHVKDPYVQRARAQGYRSRAAYKLLEIAAGDRLLRPNMAIVDLGAAPGSWSQVAVEAAGPKGLVIAVDLLPIEPLPAVQFLQGDVRAEEVRRALAEALAARPVDL